MSCQKFCCRTCKNEPACADHCPSEIKQYSERCDDEHYMSHECDRFEEVKK